MAEARPMEASDYIPRKHADIRLQQVSTLAKKLHRTPFCNAERLKKQLKSLFTKKRDALVDV